jgi:hypothetical protein
MLSFLCADIISYEEVYERLLKEMCEWALTG